MPRPSPEPSAAAAPPGKRGRPRLFDRDRALDQAMLLFWDRGFVGTSYDTLITTLGISASSFQKAFGSKEALYREAAGRYLERTSAWFAATLAAPTTARVAFAALLDTAADGFTNPDTPLGCMISAAAAQMPPSLDSITGFARELRARSEAAMAERLRRGIAEGDGPGTIDPDILAAYFATLFRGMAIQARDGASKEKLVAIGRIGMRAWPTTD